MASHGRPPTGRSGDKPVTVYLPPEDIAALDRLADLRTVRTGKNTSRSDLVREAVKTKFPIRTIGIIHAPRWLEPYNSSGCIPPKCAPYQHVKRYTTASR